MIGRTASKPHPLEEYQLAFAPVVFPVEPRCRTRELIQLAGRGEIDKETSTPQVRRMLEGPAVSVGWSKTSRCSGCSSNA